MIVRVASGAASTVIVYGPATERPVVEVAATESVYVPGVVADPVNSPLVAKASPVGSVPETIEYSGSGMPVAVNAKEYGVPTMVRLVGAPDVNSGAETSIDAVAVLPAISVAVPVTGAVMLGMMGTSAGQFSTPDRASSHVK